MFSDTDTNSGMNTPTIEDLEEKRRILQMQLAMAEGSSDVAGMEVIDSIDSPSASSQDESFVPPLPPTPDQPPLPIGTPPLTPQGVNLQTVVTTPSTGSSVEMKYGTPVTLEATPIRNKGLPELSLFSKGVSEHLPFENLPDATGNYAKMRQVIKGMRGKRESL